MPISTPFVPTMFQVPARLETPGLELRMLTMNDVMKDFDAVIMSTTHLRGIFGRGSWPQGLTLEQNLIDPGWHEKEFQERTSFAHTVLNGRAATRRAASSPPPVKHRRVGTSRSGAACGRADEFAVSDWSYSSRPTAPLPVEIAPRPSTRRPAQCVVRMRGCTLRHGRHPYKSVNFRMLPQWLHAANNGPWWSDLREELAIWSKPTAMQVPTLN